MRQFLIDFFIAYNHQIMFLHVISAIIWVGGMIVIFVAVHPSMQLIDDDKLKMERMTSILYRFFNFVIAFIIIILLTSIFMIVGMKLSGNMIINIKEGIWILMLINFIYMYITMKKTKRLLKSDDIEDAKKTIKYLPKIFLPINIFLGIVAVWLGVSV